MSICNRCCKVFGTLNQFTRHQNRKTPCKLLANTVISETEPPAVTNTLVRPLIKWVGGKTQIIDKVLCKFPLEIRDYHEIFVGGASVLLALLSKVRCGEIVVSGTIYAYDLNAALIRLYQNVQQRHNELYDKIQELVKYYVESLNDDKTGDTGSIVINRNPTNLTEAQLSKESYYYWIRKQYNQLRIMDCIAYDSISESAMFVFLNKTCFRGIYRVGPNGFNVPYGNYNNPEIINRQHLDEIHELIQGVVFECCDFGQSLNKILLESIPSLSKDFIYMDPPYAPETANSFVGYTNMGFDIDKHTELFEFMHRFTMQNQRCMMSNADVKLVRDNFDGNQKYNITELMCKRSINSKNPAAKTKEVIIINY